MAACNWLDRLVLAISSWLEMLWAGRGNMPQTPNPIETPKETEPTTPEDNAWCHPYVNRKNSKMGSKRR